MTPGDTSLSAVMLIVRVFWENITGRMESKQSFSWGGAGGDNNISSPPSLKNFFSWAQHFPFQTPHLNVIPFTCRSTKIRASSSHSTLTGTNKISLHLDGQTSGRADTRTQAYKSKTQYFDMIITKNQFADCLFFPPLFSLVSQTRGPRLYSDSSRPAVSSVTHFTRYSRVAKWLSAQ